MSEHDNAVDPVEAELDEAVVEFLEQPVRKARPGHPPPRKALDRDATGTVRAAQPTPRRPLDVPEGSAPAPATPPPAAEQPASKKAKKDKHAKGEAPVGAPATDLDADPKGHGKDGKKRSGVLVLPWPKANRKRLDRLAAEHGMSPEQLAYQVLDVWLDGDR